MQGFENVFVIDCGKNTATIYDAQNDESKYITHADVLNLPAVLPEGSLVICEAAHLGVPRTKMSKAQPFTAVYLLELYERFRNKNITLKLFPHQSTPNACTYSKLPKSDLTDPKSIYLYCRDHNVSMKNPPSSFDLDQKREASYEYKKDTDSFINVARREENKYRTDDCAKWIISNLSKIASRLSPETQAVFKLTEKSRYLRDTKDGGKKGEFKIGEVKLGSIYTIICTILNDNGEIRVRKETGAMPGWAYVWRYVLRMSPFHFKGGVGRSNLMYHHFSNMVTAAGKESGLEDVNFARKVLKKDNGSNKDKEVERRIIRGCFTENEEKIFLSERKRFNRAVRELWQAAKVVISEDKNLKYQNLEAEVY